MKPELGSTVYVNNMGFVEGKRVYFVGEESFFAMEVSYAPMEKYYYADEGNTWFATEEEAKNRGR